MSKYPSTVCLLIGPPALRLYTTAGEVLFEDHPACGPLPVTKTGKERTLVASHPFWNAVTKWYADGKLTDGDKCVFAPTRGEGEP